MTNNEGTFTRSEAEALIDPYAGPNPDVIIEALMTSPRARRASQGKNAWIGELLRQALLAAKRDR
jgi:hypothetical protein